MALGVSFPRGVAELAEIFQWMTPDDPASLGEANSAAVADEPADVMISLAHVADIDLGAAVARKLEHDSTRTPGERGWVDPGVTYTPPRLTSSSALGSV